MTTVPDRPPPSTVSYVIATAILAISLGYFVGQGSSLGLFSSSRSKSKSASGKSWPNSYDVTIHPDSSDEELMTHLRGPGGRGVKGSEDEDEEDEEEEQGELKAFEGIKEECKLVLVVRTDLGMGKGKSLAPGCLEERVSKY
jgi:PTH2 family peptidyl-tRNA hydrolase